MTPDVNVLVAASRSDHPYHTIARSWIETALLNSASGSTFTLMPMVLASFLRLVTSPRIFKAPTPIDEAVRFVEALLAIPSVNLNHLGPEWRQFLGLCRAKQLGGNNLPNAWLAAATTFCGEHLVSFDRDFRRLLDRSQFTLLDATSS